MENIGMSKLNKILLIIAGAILLSILAVTAISLGNKNIHPGQGLRKEDNRNPWRHG